jgi:hypothetical protein
MAAAAAANGYLAFESTTSRGPARSCGGRGAAACAACCAACPRATSSCTASTSMSSTLSSALESVLVRRPCCARAGAALHAALTQPNPAGGGDDMVPLARPLIVPSVVLVRAPQVARTAHAHARAHRVNSRRHARSRPSSPPRARSKSAVTAAAVHVPRWCWTNRTPPSLVRPPRHVEQHAARRPQARRALSRTTLRARDHCAPPPQPPQPRRTLGACLPSSSLSERTPELERRACNRCADDSWKQPMLHNSSLAAAKKGRPPSP